MSTTYMTVTNRIQGTHESITTPLYITDCPSCGVVFAIPRTLEDRRRADGKNLFCPNGHMSSWRETDVDRANQKLARETRLREAAERRADLALDNAQREKRRAAAARGQLTKMRNRVANGVCPQAGCKRSFTELHDHIRTCHPDLVEALGVED